MKRLLRLRNNGGFTLAEVIVACALLTILMMGMFAFMTPVLNSITEKNANAHAVLTAEALDTFIINSVRSASYAKVYPDVTGNINDVISAEIAAGGEIKKMIEYATANSSVELRCVGLRYVKTEPSKDWKIIATREIVNQTNAQLDNTNYTHVFEDCFYDGLYPIVFFNTIDNQYKTPDTTSGASSGALVNAVATDKEHNVGIQATMYIYTNDNCYNINRDKRAAEDPTYVGRSFTNLTNIGNPLANPYNSKEEGNYKYKIYDMPSGYTIPEIADVADHYPATVTPAVTEDGESFYYPSTFIYYVIRKSPMRPTTTSTPTSTPTSS